MPSIRRWRPLILVAAAWLLCLWYLVGSGTSDADGRRRGGGTPFSGNGGPQSQEDMRWAKLPERYPVKSLKTLPTGKPTTPIPPIQRAPPPEGDEARQLRLGRLAAVKESFLHSWNGYKEHAWLHDEVAPLTGRGKDPFGGWAATLVDALDTLWIMDLRDEFELAVGALDRIDFSTTPAQSINVFETTIRYLGGLLAAHELSGGAHPVLLAKAVEVADLLMCAFDTPNRMPVTRWDWRSYMTGAAQAAPRTVLVSELGSLSLEFTKLSQLTGDARYYDAVQRIADAFDTSQLSTKLPGMWPVVVDGYRPSFSVSNDFTLGGMSDSLYEYFPKQYLILGGLLAQPRKLYEGFIDVAKRHLFRRVLNRDNLQLVIPGDARVTSRDGEVAVVTTPRGQHLTCFAGAMVGLASRVFKRPRDMELAEQLTDACVWSYNTSASGIGPEVYSFVACGGVGDAQMGDGCRYSEAKWHAGIQSFWRLQPAPTPAPAPAPAPHPSKRDNGDGGGAWAGGDGGDGGDGGGSNGDEKREEAEPPAEDQAAVMTQRVKGVIASRKLTPGLVDVTDKRYILRPEAIESVFVMHRLTGDPAWMEKGWAMFERVERLTRTGIAAASLDDVTAARPRQVDSMESFWLAETLKYFYLLYADFDVVSLDEWVLNTEAHPLRRPDA